MKKDTIQLFHGLSGEIPSGLKKQNIKSVVTIHDLIFMRYPHLYSFIDRKIHYLKFKKAAKNADLIIAISEQTKQDIIHYLKIEDQKIKVVYQGCQPIFKTEIPNAILLKVKEKFNLPDEFVLNVGTIEERKNALSIVKAIKNSRTTLVLIGKQTDYTEQIHTYSKEHSLQQNIIFLKGITSDELAAIYQLATLFIYPSIFEGFGIPIIEALFSKTPVITTNSGVFPEAGGPHTIYVDPYDIREMEEKITFLLANPDIRKTIADKGFEFAQQFNDEVIAKNMMGIYESLV